MVGIMSISSVARASGSEVLKGVDAARVTQSVHGGAVNVCNASYVEVPGAFANSSQLHTFTPRLLFLLNTYQVTRSSVSPILH